MAQGDQLAGLRMVIEREDLSAAIQNPDRVIAGGQVVLGKGPLLQADRFTRIQHKLPFLYGRTEDQLRERGLQRESQMNRRVPHGNRSRLRPITVVYGLDRVRTGSQLRGRTGEWFAIDYKSGLRDV